jgi:hypothetical protein
MLPHIGQRLLGDPIHGESGIQGQYDRPALDMKATRYADVVLEFLDKLRQEVRTGGGSHRAATQLPSALPPVLPWPARRSAPAR